MYMPASTDQAPVLLTLSADRARPQRRRAIVSTLNRELDASDVEGRTDPSSPWASIQGTNIVVQIWPGVSSIGAVKNAVFRAIPTARFVSTTPLISSVAA